ncbi:MAG: hypothetical protein ACRCTJ_02855 [Brevinema sp.]
MPIFLIIFPVVLFADIFVDFENLSYSNIIHSLEETSLSSTSFIIAHPYQKNLCTNSYLSDILTNYHKHTLEKLFLEAKKNNNKIYFSIDHIQMKNNKFFSLQTDEGKFIPNLQDKKEIKNLIDRLVLISQTNKFGLKIDLSFVPEKQKKSIESQIKKIIPNIIFLHGSGSSISSKYYEWLKKNLSELDDPKILSKKLPNTIHFISEKDYFGISVSALFWFLSQKKSVLINYHILSHSYILQLVGFLQQYDKSFKIVHAEKNNLMLSSPNYIMNLSLSNKLAYKKINYNIVGDNILQSIYSSSPLLSNKNNLEFLAWPFSVLVWKYK